jgi:hypothetical protein
MTEKVEYHDRHPFCVCSLVFLFPVPLFALFAALGARLLADLGCIGPQSGSLGQSLADRSQGMRMASATTDVKMAST